MNIFHTISFSLVFLVGASTHSWGDEKKPSDDAKQKLVEQCLRQMTEADGTGKAMSFNTLQKLGPDASGAIPALTKALNHEDSYVRIQSAYTLWKIDGRAGAIPLLGKALEEKDIKTRDRALAANFLRLAGPGAKAALPSLIEATKDPDAQIRVNAAWALWTVDQRSTLAKPVVIESLKDDDLNVFSTAAAALGEMGFDKSALTALKEALRVDAEKDSKVHAAARALPGLADGLKSDDAEIRKEAISVMTLMGNGILALGSRNPGARAAITAITKALKDEDPLVRATAAEALKKIDPKGDFIDGGEDNKPAGNIPGAKAVATAFIIALAKKNAQEAAKYVIPDERDDFASQLDKGMPSLPDDPELKVRVKDDGIRASVILLNPKKPTSGPPFGLNMRLSKGKWWIVK